MTSKTIEITQNPAARAAGFCFAPNFLFYPLALAKHPFKHPLHRRQGGDDDTENRIHADGEEIVDQRVNPGVAKPVFLRIGAKENRAGNRARHHPQKPRDSRAQRQVLREERGGAKQRKRHEVV